MHIFWGFELLKLILWQRLLWQRLRNIWQRPLWQLNELNWIKYHSRIFKIFIILRNLHTIVLLKVKSWFELDDSMLVSSGFYFWYLRGPESMTNRKYWSVFNRVFKLWPWSVYTGSLHSCLTHTSRHTPQETDTYTQSDMPKQRKRKQFVDYHSPTSWPIKF